MSGVKETGWTVFKFKFGFGLFHMVIVDGKPCKQRTQMNLQECQ
jgi:hypothetical protein